MIFFLLDPSGSCRVPQPYPNFDTDCSLEDLCQNSILLLIFVVIIDVVVYRCSQRSHNHSLHQKPEFKVEEIFAQLTVGEGPASATRHPATVGAGDDAKEGEIDG